MRFKSSLLFLAACILLAPSCGGTVTVDDGGAVDSGAPIDGSGGRDTGHPVDGGVDGGHDGGADANTGPSCAVSHGGCDALVTCTDSATGPVCGDCPTGYTGTGATACTDIDECATGNGGCDALTTCTNTPGAHTCGNCPLGYTGTGATACTDVDECATNNGGCDPLVACTNTAGGFTCGDCPTGFTGGGASGCVDIDECATNNGGCDALTTCTNTAGSRTCGACPTGYTGDGVNGCVDIDECATGNGGCDALTTCTNTAGSRSCSACPSGYSGDGVVGCTDIDECATNNGGCGAVTAAACANNVGAPPTCSCLEGYQDHDANGSCELACGSTRNCSALYAAGARTDGIYSIDPDGAGGAAPYDVYCLMTVGGGGWTEVYDQDLALGVLPKAAWANVNPTAPNAGQYSILDQISSFANVDGTYELYMDWPDLSPASYVQWTQDGSPMVWADGARGTVSGVTAVPAGLRGDSGGFNGLALSSADGAFLDIDDGGSWWGAVGVPIPYNGGIPAYRTAAGAETISQHARVFVRSTNIVGLGCAMGSLCVDASGPAACVVPSVQILVDCAPDATLLDAFSGSGCHSPVSPGGASYNLLGPNTPSVTVWSGVGCTGCSETLTVDTNFCGASFSGGCGGLNDNVQSISLP